MMNNKRFFEWIYGEYLGHVVSLSYIEDIDGEIIYTFDDGESCNQRFIAKMTNDVAELKGKLLVEIDSPSNCWSFEEVKPKFYKDDDGNEVEIPRFTDITQVKVNPIVDGEGKEFKAVKPTRRQSMKDLPKIEDFPNKALSDVNKENVENSLASVAPEAKVEVAAGPVSAAKEEPAPRVKAAASDPVAIIVDSCAKHPTEIPITLTIELPTKSLYKIAASEFENGGDRFIDYIVEKINTDSIIESLKKSLLEEYNSED